jgi:hypothetical protein
VAKLFINSHVTVSDGPQAEPRWTTYKERHQHEYIMVLRWPVFSAGTTIIDWLVLAERPRDKHRQYFLVSTRRFSEWSAPHKDIDGYQALIINTQTDKRVEPNAAQLLIKTQRENVK